MLRWLLVQNRQGKTRLAKFYVPLDDDEKVRLKGEVHRLIAPRDQKYQSNFVEVSCPVDGIRIDGDTDVAFLSSTATIR